MDAVKKNTELGIYGNAFDQKGFNDFILGHNVVGFFENEITLKSGRKSHFYVNWRKPTEDALLTDILSNYVIRFIKSKGLQVDTIYGVPEGATKLAVITQFKYSKDKNPVVREGDFVLAMGRGKIKDHGSADDRLFLGKPKGNVLVLEDTTTTGGSLIDTITMLQKEGINVVAAVGLTNRNERRDDGNSVAEALQKLGVKYYPMSNATELLPEAAKKSNTRLEILDKVEEEFKEYGEKSLKFYARK